MAGSTISVHPVECASGETPVCQDYRCVSCASDFDCTEAANPLCDEPTFACVPGYSSCVGDDPAEITREVDDQPAAERFAGQPRTSATGVDWQMVFRSISYHSYDIADRSWSHHAQRPQLIDTGIARIKLREYVVAADVALHEAAQVFLERQGGAKPGAKPS